MTQRTHGQCPICKHYGADCHCALGDTVKETIPNPQAPRGREMQDANPKPVCEKCGVEINDFRSRTDGLCEKCVVEFLEDVPQEARADTSPFSTADADRILGIGDQFVEDWENDNGDPDKNECARCRAEWDQYRALFVKAPEMLDVLKRLTEWAAFMGGFDSPIWGEARRLAFMASHDLADRPILAIVVEGGMIQSVVSNRPDAFACDVIVIDYDCDGADEDDRTLVPQSRGDESEAVVHVEAIDLATIDLATTLARLNGKAVQS